jgi:hypothetical protein
MMCCSSPELEIVQGVSLDEAKRIAADISTLSSAQRDALQNAPYLLMSRLERGAYDRRRAHIAHLTTLLMSLESNVGHEKQTSDTNVTL